MHAAEDEKKKSEAEAKNIAEQMIYTAEKSLKEAGDKVTADIKSDVEAKVADLKKAKDGTDVDAIKKATEALSSSMQKIGEAMMKNQQANAQSGADKKDDGKDGNVKDAEYTEKK
jgi:molecular chaperone DnaK